MVVWWKLQRERAIKIQKYRIAHHEKHGNGKVAEEEKYTLQKMIRHNKLQNEADAK